MSYFSNQNQVDDIKADCDVNLELVRLSSEIVFQCYKLYGNVRNFSVAEVSKKILRFYSGFGRPFYFLSPTIIGDTLQELRKARRHTFSSIPEITYVVPIFQCSGDKLHNTIQSIVSQVGVLARGILVLDGSATHDREVVEEQLSLLGAESSFRIIVKSENSGVARARNTGMALVETEFFSWLDAHDVIHPLRSLHSILLLLNDEVKRVNTSCSRVSMSQKKVVIRNLRHAFCGHTSFVARSEIIARYGYLSDLVAHEDTEYQQRMEFFGLEMSSTDIVAHYLDMILPFDKEPGSHLSSDAWSQVESIADNGFIAGSYVGKITDSRRLLNEQFRAKYQYIQRKMLLDAFPCIE